MKLINKKQGTVSCAGYVFEPNVPVEVPDDLAKRLLEKASLLLEVYSEGGKDGKEKAKEEKG